MLRLRLVLSGVKTFPHLSIYLAKFIGFYHAWYTSWIGQAALTRVGQEEAGDPGVREGDLGVYNYLYTMVMK